MDGVDQGNECSAGVDQVIHDHHPVMRPYAVEENARVALLNIFIGQRNLNFPGRARWRPASQGPRQILVQEDIRNDHCPAVFLAYPVCRAVCVLRVESTQKTNGARQVRVQGRDIAGDRGGKNSNTRPPPFQQRDAWGVHRSRLG